MVLDHAKARHGETGKDTHRIKRHQAADFGIKGDHQDDRHRAENDDAIREGQSVATLRHLNRQEPVTSDKVGQEGEPVERGIPPCIKNKHRAELHHEEENVSKGTSSKNRLDLLGHHRWRTRGEGNGVGPARQQ